jgi:hypothetical protein
MAMESKWKSDWEFTKWLFETYPGYTQDFYMCVTQRKDEVGLDVAVMICEAWYG